MQSAGNTTLSGVGGLIRRIVPFTFVLELTGALLLATRFVPALGWGRGLYASVFHAISAFCNAGFDLMGMREPFSSMTAFVADPVVNLTLCALIVIGGLGFLVWRDVVRCRFRFSKFQLHTKLVLVTSGILILGAGLLLLIFERNASMADLTWPQRVLASLFQAIAPRTAGFNTVDLSKLSNSSNLLTDVLMLIGGSPGSTAGGFKTTTVAVLFLSALASSKGRMRVNAFRYSVDRETLRQASSVVMIYLSLTFFSVLTLCAIEPFTLKEILFEVCSAVGTVGSTLGITTKLSAVSRVIIILLMYAGRLGGMSFVLLFTERRSDPPLERPAGKILIG